MSLGYARTPLPQRLVLGTFCFLLATVIAVSPLPLLARSLGVALMCYAAFAFAGLPFAFAGALFAPLAGLFSGGEGWLVMLPLILVSGLLAFLGLDYAWRKAALIVSPLLYALPQLIAWQLSQRSLFTVELPWQPSAPVWIGAHAAVAFAGTGLALWWRSQRRQSGRYRRERRER